MVQISVKWSGQKYPVDVDAAQTGLVLKTQLFSLTGVAPDRQKIMVKGGMLKDETPLASLGLKDGQQLMMMGTAGELPKAPEKPVVFMEDMTDAQIAQALKLPAGLTNLGNTCYMNATIQCLRTVPELLQAMELMEPPRGQDQHANLTIAMRSLFQLLNKSGDSVPPLVFLQVLRSVFPQFAESNNHGFMQQDAEECWGQIVHALSDRVPALTPTGEVAKEGHFVDQFMSTEVISTTTCDEVPEEPAATTIETFNKMRVNIGPGVSTYLVSEIAASLTEKIEKNSPTLNRSSVYTKTSKISRLPQYLAINFVRFQWKPQERVKAKILKRVQFPFELDMTPFCTTELQHKLAPAKQRLKEVAEKKADEKKRKKQAPAGDVEMTPAEGSSSAAPTAADAKKKHMAVLEEIGVEPSFLQDPGVNPSGQYDLVAVLTHMGRAADSGHYIGWAKQEGSDNWWKYDDDKVSQVKQEAITKLEGGGDWHTAYICLYRAKMLE